MAAQIPAKDKPEINEAAFAKIREDKEREVKDGHDGTWIAHPGMIQTALDVFNQHMPSANQIHRKRKDVKVEEKTCWKYRKAELQKQASVPISAPASAI